MTSLAEEQKDRFSSPETQMGYEDLARQYASWFLQWIATSGSSKPTSILDVGCRTGASTQVFSSMLPKANVMGVDVVPEAVDEAQANGVNALVCDVQELDKLGMTFDYAFVSQVLEHVPDLSKAIDALETVVSRGMFVGVPLESKESFDSNDKHHHWGDTWWWMEHFKEKWNLVHLFYDHRVKYLNLVIMKKKVSA